MLQQPFVLTAPPPIMLIVSELERTFEVVDEMEGATAVTNDMRDKALGLPTKIKTVEKKLKQYKAELCVDSLCQSCCCETVSRNLLKSKTDLRDPVSQYIQKAKTY